MTCYSNSWKYPKQCRPWCDAVLGYYNIAFLDLNSLSMWEADNLARLCICADLFEPSLLADAIRTEIPCVDAFIAQNTFSSFYFKICVVYLNWDSSSIILKVLVLKYLNLKCSLRSGSKGIQVYFESCRVKQVHLFITIRVVQSLNS